MSNGRINGKQIIDSTVIKTINGLSASNQFVLTNSDTNITLITATSGSTTSITAGWSGLLPISRGGLSNSVFTASQILMINSSNTSVVSSGYIFSDSATSSTNIWSANRLIGYIGETASGNSGDIQLYNPIGGLTSSTQFNYNIASQSLTIGPVGATLSYNPFSANGSGNTFIQMNVQNISSGQFASSDVVATANIGNDNTNYINMGINSSTYADPGFTITGLLDGYIYTSGGDMAVGTDTNDILLFTGGTLISNLAVRIKYDNSVIFGSQSAIPTTATAGFLYIPASAGKPTATPTTYFGTPLSSDSTDNSLYYYTNSNWRSTTGATATSPIANPVTTTSTTGVMMGIGASCSITPRKSGTILVIVTGDMDNATAADGAGIQIRYGTGTAPINGAALTGTTAGGLIKMTNVATVTGSRSPFSSNAIVAGLTIGTAYYIDVSLAAITGGTARIRDVIISAIEI